MRRIVVSIFAFSAILVHPAFANTIQISSNVTDTVAPVINSYSFSASTIHLGSPINLSINASDTSEISTVWATFRYPNSSTVNYTAFLSEGTNQTGIFTIQFNSTGELGFYTVTYIFVNDSYSNLTYNFSVITFSVVEAAATSSAGPGFGGASITETVEEEAEEEIPPAPSTIPTEKCVESWTCTGWSDCIDNTRTRTCTDSSDCGTTEEKPIESEDCALATTPEEQVPLGVPLGVWSFASLLVAALVVYVYMKKRKMRKGRIRHFKKVK